jgi:signal transduction histidine kinase
MLYPGLNETIVAIRYTYGFWGSLFLGVGLYFYGEAIRKINHKEMLKLYFKISGIAFIAYAFFAGIVVPPVDHFPANVINSTWFLDTFHLPVQIFRSICAVIIAISSIKALEIFKLEVTEKLNESYQQIKEFNANASHQLKSPLSSMKVQIDVTLQKERDCKEYKTVLSSITEDIIHLQDMLHNLLLLTRMNDRSIKDSFKNVAVDTLLLNSIDKFMIISGKKKIALHVESLDSTNIQANPTLIEVLIDNLLDNAIKYTLENKNITIKLESNILTIKDEGIGIEKDKLPLIFNKFYQIDSRRKKGIYGYGLGLAMVKQISDLHNASIYITSVIHEGTTISVKF